MQLSLTVRIAEDFKVKDRAHLGFTELARIAAECGYDAICMRASQAGVHIDRDRLAEMKALLDTLGLHVTMVTGDVPLAANDERAGQALRDIEPYLDLATTFDAPLVRIMIKTPADLSLASLAAAAHERELTLAHQMHTGTLVETIDEALAVARTVDSPAFGITYEPANLMACGEPWDRHAIARLAPILVNVYLQNHRLDPAGADTLRRREGPVRVTNLPHRRRRHRLNRATPRPSHPRRAINYSGYGFTALILACIAISSGPQNVLMYSSTALISSGVNMSSYAIMRLLNVGDSYSFPPRKTISYSCPSA